MNLQLLSNSPQSDSPITLAVSAIAKLFTPDHSLLA